MTAVELVKLLGMKWKHLPIVAFDTETTGLDPFTGDRIIEFAAVILHIGPDGEVASQEEVSFLVNPTISIPPKVTEITGIADVDVVDAPTFDVVADRIWEVLSNSITVAHNYQFDLAFLTQEFLRVDSAWPEPLAEIDTYDLSLKHYAEERTHRLETLCARLGIRLEGAHRATNDAEACGRAFLEMARRHNVEDDIQAMLDWARAIGRPPENGPLAANKTGCVVFLEGPYKGQPVADHPIHLAWIEKARVRGPRGWDYRFPESTRRWVRRWMEVRGSGRARLNPKSFHAADWVIDPCITDSRRMMR